MRQFGYYVVVGPQRALGRLPWRFSYAVVVWRGLPSRARI